MVSVSAVRRLSRNRVLLPLAVLLALILLLLSCAESNPVTVGTVRGHRTDHFDGSRFFNLGTESWSSQPHRHGLFGAVKWILSHHPGGWKWRPNVYHPQPQQRVYGSELVVTFVNHATVLIQTEGLNILTDPVWSNRVGPFPGVGPKRHRPPGIEFSDLPPIDLVLISHNHYDHMDLPTLRRLRSAWNPRILTGLGNSDYLRFNGMGRAEDTDWWNRKQITDSVSVMCVPAQHFSGRGLSDRDKTLWCGFVIETPHGNIYFAGDTGFGPFLDRIHEHYSSLRLALLPIGAFLPRWFMQPIHESPDEALEAQRMLNARTAIGIHFGTFALADDGQDQPPERIHELLQAEAEPRQNFITPDNGQTFTVK